MYGLYFFKKIKIDTKSKRIILNVRNMQNSEIKQMKSEIRFTYVVTVVALGFK